LEGYSNQTKIAINETTGFSAPYAVALVLEIGCVGLFAKAV